MTAEPIIIHLWLCRLPACICNRRNQTRSRHQKHRPVMHSGSIWQDLPSYLQFNVNNNYIRLSRCQYPQGRCVVTSSFFLNGVHHITTLPPLLFRSADSHALSHLTYHICFILFFSFWFVVTSLLEKRPIRTSFLKKDFFLLTIFIEFIQMPLIQVN